MWTSMVLPVFCDQVDTFMENLHYIAPTMHAPQEVHFKQMSKK